MGSLEAYIGARAPDPGAVGGGRAALAHRLREDNDIAAAQELVLSHLRFVVHVARGYSGYGLQLGDLIQEGNIGLMKAVKRFDPDRGRAPGQLRGALDPRRDARVHPQELAHREGRHHQGAAQAVLQPAQEQDPPGLAQRGGSPRGRQGPERVRARGAGNGVAPVRPRHRLRRARRRRRRPRPAGAGRATWSPHDADPAAGLRVAPTAKPTSWSVLREGLAGSTRVRATSSGAAGWMPTARSRCRSWPTNTASPPSASARSRPTR